MWKVLSGIFLGWSLGANDSANIFGTGVATGLVKYKIAILLTAVFVMIGGLFEGTKCMGSVTEFSLILPSDAFYCALAAAITMTILTCLAIPASASQAIVGAVLGAGILSGSADFSKFGKIFLCWMFTPVSGILFGYGLYRSLMFLLDKTVNSLTYRNHIYSWGIILSGCYAAYCLGGNNVANVTGVYVGSGILDAQTASLIGGLSISIGVVTYSKKVMMTIGKNIAPLDPFSALVAVLAEAFTLHLFTQIGVPVSSSQAVVGAVVGVGLVGGLRTVSSGMLIKIALGWLMTPISACIIAGLLIGLLG